MDYLMQLVDVFLHVDRHLDAIIQHYGFSTHLLLFVIVFCETGLVVTPFLPGDSLLFAAGAFASRGSLDIGLIIGLLIVAAVLGDAVNYHIGKLVGPKAFRGGRFLKKEYLLKTQHFYEKYGGKTIIIARFVPIVRTFAPFLAGVGTMSYRRFAIYNVTGGVVWVLTFSLAGYWFGGISMVKENFTLVIMAIIVISVLPAVIEYVRARQAGKADVVLNGE